MNAKQGNEIQLRLAASEMRQVRDESEGERGRVC